MLVVLGLAFELHSVPANHLPVGLKRQGRMGLYPAWTGLGGSGTGGGHRHGHSPLDTGRFLERMPAIDG